MKIEKFENLDCWKKARETVKMVYEFTKLEEFSKDFGLSSQIQRSAVSIMANIAEGFGTKSNKEFIRYLSMAIRSAYETESHLYVAIDIGYINNEKFNKLVALTNDCINLCKGLIRYLKEQ